MSLEEKSIYKDERVNGVDPFLVKRLRRKFVQQSLEATSRTNLKIRSSIDTKNFSKVTASARSRHLLISTDRKGESSLLNLPRIPQSSKHMGLQYLKHSGDLKALHKKRQYQTMENTPDLGEIDSVQFIGSESSPSQSIRNTSRGVFPLISIQSHLKKEVEKIQMTNLISRGLRNVIIKKKKSQLHIHNERLEPFTDPIQLLPQVKRIVHNIKVSDKNYQMIEVSKKEFTAHIMLRYKGLSLTKKLISFFFPTGGENKKIRFNDLYRSVNQMLSWSVQEQLGFIFYLFDYNEDGFICIQDLFHLLRELNDQDHVLREDVNKLIQILKEKGKRLRKTKQISPIIYGIYNNYESQTNKKVIYNDYLALERDIQVNSIKKALFPMVWDKQQHKLIPYHEPKETINNSSDEEDETTYTQEFNDEELESLKKEQRARKKLIKNRNQQIDSNFMSFVNQKYQRLQYKQRYYEVKDSEIEQEFDVTNLTNSYMRSKKFKEAIDYIQFHEFCDIHHDRAQFIRNNITQHQFRKTDFESKNFEYPLIFLEIIYHICGAQISFQQNNYEDTMRTEESSNEEILNNIAPYKGMSSDNIYAWFNNTLEKLRNDEEYQQQKILNETFTKMMREGYEEAKKKIYL